MRILHTIILVLMLAVLSGCGASLPSVKPFKMEVQQGNVVTSKMLLQLRPGMTKSQVRFIMGTPLVVDSFHTNRWDYFYQMRQKGKITEQRRVILDFENDVLAKVRGDVVPAGTTAETETVNTAARSIDTAKPKDKTLAEKLKFWKADEQVKTTELEKAKAEAAKPKEKTWAEKLQFWKKDEAAAKTVDAATTAVDTAKEAAATVPPVVAVVPNVEASGSEPTNDEPTSVLAQKIELPAEIPPVESAKSAKPVIEAAKEKMDEVAKTLETTKLEAVKEAVAEKVMPETPAVPEVIAPVVATPIAPAAPIESKPSQAVVGVDNAAVEAALNNWADAWRNKDIKRYLAAYAPNFKPDNLSRKNWLAQRKQRLSGKQGDIRVGIEDLKISADGDTATAQFYQQYASARFSDAVTKQLTFMRDKTGQWLIIKEAAIENAARPTKSEVTAPESSSEHLDGVIEKIGF